jgi:hypothetical protein
MFRGSNPSTGDFLLSKNTQPSIHLVPGSFQESKCPGRVGVHSPPICDGVKEWRYASATLMCLHGVYRGQF